MNIEDRYQDRFAIEQHNVALQSVRSSHDLRVATQDFEALFIQKLLQVMQEGQGKNDMLHSKQEEIWRSLLNEEYAKEFSQAGGIGLADMLYEYLAPLVLQEEEKHSSASKALESYQNAMLYT